MVEQPKPELNFKSLNPAGSRTLLLLHGTFASHHAFQLLLSRPHLKNYHILIPDLPHHGLSKNLNIPFTLPAIAAVITDLIAKHAKNGRADLVGDDLGGYIALYLTSKYPDLITSTFATGYERDYSSGLYSTWMTIKTYCSAVLGMVLIPRSWLLPVMKKLDMDINESVMEDMQKTIGWSYTWNMFWMLCRDWGNGKSICEAIGARTLIIAAGRQDLVESVRERGVWLRKGGDGNTRAVMVNGARHAWALQAGKVDLMSRGVQAWVDGETLPVDYEVLEGVD